MKHFHPLGTKSYPAIVNQAWESETDRASKMMLDCSVGIGKTTAHLRGMGFQVWATDYAYERPEFLPDDAKFVGGVDLNQRLPFPDESFDCINLQEVIEHVENPVHIIREYNRILKPGGAWVFATPNIHSYSSRLRFLATGFVKGRKRMVNYVRKPVPGDNLFLVNIWQMHYLLWHYGFVIEELVLGPIHPLSVLFYPILHPLNMLFSYRALRMLRDKDVVRGAPGFTLEEAQAEQNKAREDLRKFMFSSKFVLSENLILRVRKVSDFPHTADYMPVPIEAKGDLIEG